MPLDFPALAIRHLVLKTGLWYEFMICARNETSFPDTSSWYAQAMICPRIFWSVRFHVQLRLSQRFCVKHKSGSFSSPPPQKVMCHDHKIHTCKVNICKDARQKSIDICLVEILSTSMASYNEPTVKPSLFINYQLSKPTVKPSSMSCLGLLSRVQHVGLRYPGFQQLWYHEAMYLLGIRIWASTLRRATALQILACEHGPMRSWGR